MTALAYRLIMLLVYMIVRTLLCVKQTVKRLTYLVVMAVAAALLPAVIPFPIIVHGILEMASQCFPNLDAGGSLLGLFLAVPTLESAGLSWNGRFQRIHPRESVLTKQTL
jgi:hypothetical protein